jgi:hypothetical protein
MRTKVNAEPARRGLRAEFELPTEPADDPDDPDENDDEDRDIHAMVSERRRAGDERVPQPG